MAAVLAIALAAFLAACGDDDDGGGGTQACSVASPGAAPTDAPPNPPNVGGDIVTTATGLTYVDVCTGTGDTPGPTSDVSVYYSGYLQANGAKFDSSVDRGEPQMLEMDNVIEGFREGLSTMKEGGRRRLIIPSELGYGPEGSTNVIPPNAILIFDVELIAVVN